MVSCKVYLFDKDSRSTKLPNISVQNGVELITKAKSLSELFPDYDVKILSERKEDFDSIKIESLNRLKDEEEVLAKRMTVEEYWKKWKVKKNKFCGSRIVN